MKQVSYFGLLPAAVRYDTRLCPHAKVLYADIWALSRMNGVCQASNAYFSELYGVSIVSVSKWIAELIQAGYVKATYERPFLKSPQVRRCLSLLEGGLKEKLKGNKTLTECNNIFNPLSPLMDVSLLLEASEEERGEQEGAHPSDSAPDSFQTALESSQTGVCVQTKMGKSPQKGSSKKTDVASLDPPEELLRPFKKTAVVFDKAKGTRLRPDQSNGAAEGPERVLEALEAEDMAEGSEGVLEALGAEDAAEGPEGAVGAGDACEGPEEALGAEDMAERAEKVEKAEDMAERPEEALGAEDACERAEKALGALGVQASGRTRKAGSVQETETSRETLGNRETETPQKAIGNRETETSQKTMRALGAETSREIAGRREKEEGREVSEKAIGALGSETSRKKLRRKSIRFKTCSTGAPETGRQGLVSASCSLEAAPNKRVLASCPAGQKSGRLKRHRAQSTASQKTDDLINAGLLGVWGVTIDQAAQDVQAGEPAQVSTRSEPLMTPPSKEARQTGGWPETDGLSGFSFDSFQIPAAYRVGILDEKGIQKAALISLEHPGSAHHCGGATKMRRGRQRHPGRFFSLENCREGATKLGQGRQRHPGRFFSLENCREGATKPGRGCPLVFGCFKGKTFRPHKDGIEKETRRTRRPAEPGPKGRGTSERSQRGRSRKGKKQGAFKECFWGLQNPASFPRGGGTSERPKAFFPKGALKEGQKARGAKEGQKARGRSRKGFLGLQNPVSFPKGRLREGKKQEAPNGFISQFTNKNKKERSFKC